MAFQVGGSEYKRLDLHDQILLRPDTYIGSPAGMTSENVWNATILPNGAIYVKNDVQPICLSIVGISKELFDNVSDNAQRSRIAGIDPGVVEIVKNTNMICVKNYGKHIPVVMHETEKMLVPSMIFGVLLTSDNYDDNESVARYKIGRNGYGIKLANIFSSAFSLEVADPVNHLLMKQTWSKNMFVSSQPEITKYDGPGYTQVAFVPDFNRLHGNKDPNTIITEFSESMNGYYLCRAMEMSFATKLPVYYNGALMDFRDGMTFFNTHFSEIVPDRGIIHWMSPDGMNEFVVGDVPNAGFLHAFVNGSPVHQGEHVNEYLRVIFEQLTSEFEKKNGKKVTVAHLKKHVGLLLRVTLDKPEFDSQIKKKLIKPKPRINGLSQDLLKPIMKWKLVEELKAMFGMKEKKEENKVSAPELLKLSDAIAANSRDPNERLKSTLILVEGDTGKSLVMSGMKYLPGGKMYNGVLPLRGKVMNVNRHSDERVDSNREIKEIMSALGAERDVDYFNDLNARKKLRYGRVAVMADADYDGYHINGLVIGLIFKFLKSLAPFEFLVIIMTPTLEGFKGKERITFFHLKQYNKWLKQQQDGAKGWKWRYYKGLGSWTPSADNLKRLFEKPVIVAMAVDPETNDILKLAFDKNLTNSRKAWIAGYDPNSELTLTSPRPVTSYFMEEFRDYSKAAVIRAIPRLMDGMKPVHRKIVWSAFKKFGSSNKFVKMVQFSGFVMEYCEYHHGDASLNKAVRQMGQYYVTSGNNINIIEAEGNYGQRYGRGSDASHPRYLFCGLSDIARYIYRKEDDGILEMLHEDGNVIEPKELYPVIPMCLVNQCEGIGTGWSTKIYPHDPRIVLQWVKQWVAEKRSKRDIPYDQLTIDLSTKPILIPWWRGYSGNLVRVKNSPFEAFRNEGRFETHGHSVFVRELPAEMSIGDYENWGKEQVLAYLQDPGTGILRSFTMPVPPPAVGFEIYGMSAPTLEKLNLVRSVSMSNMVLIDTDDFPKKYNYTFEIMCEWCLKRLKIYEKRRVHMLKAAEKKARFMNLKYQFIMDVVEKRLDLRGTPTAEVEAYMESKGYPYGKNKGKKTKKTTKAVAGIIDPEAEEEDDLEKKDFLAIPLRTITKEAAAKCAKELEDAMREYNYYKTTFEEDIWLRDLEDLEVRLAKYISDYERENATF